MFNAPHLVLSDQTVKPYLAMWVIGIQGTCGIHFWTVSVDIWRSGERVVVADGLRKGVLKVECQQQHRALVMLAKSRIQVLITLEGALGFLEAMSQTSVK